MRDYGKVHTKFWASRTIRSCSEDARTLALYLLTSAHSNICGAFRLPDGYVCEDLNEDLGWGSERVRKGFTELFRKGFANRCETTKWVWVCDHFEWNPLENPNQRKAALKIALQVPDECAWKADFLEKCGAIVGLSIEEIAEISATLPKGFRDQDQDQDQKQEQEQDQEQGDARGKRGPPNSDARADTRANVQQVFDHWAKAWEHPGAKLDAKRAKRIEARLKDGFTVEQLCNAISGFKHSPWHTGTDPKGNGTVYDGIETLLRDTAQVEKGLEHYANPPAKTNGANGSHVGAEASQAWNRVLIHVKTSAYRSNTPSLDPRIDQVVRYIGGYPLIGSKPESELPFFRAKFIKAWSEGAP
jgi:hypothetical protein